jgi:hypothetical protein
VTAPYAADETDYSLQYVRDRLGRLVEHGNARKVYEGLYELVDDPRHRGEGDDEADSVDVTPTPEGTEDTTDTPGDDVDYAGGSSNLKNPPESIDTPGEEGDGGFQNSENPSGESIDTPELSNLSFPAGVEHDDAVDAIHAAAAYVRQSDGASMREIVDAVASDYPLKYDPPETVPDEGRFRSTWWRKVVKPGLKELPHIQPPAAGASDWTAVEKQ